MKEKRVDIYLAKAGFAQVLTIAFGGGCVNEFFEGNFNKAILAAFGMLVTIVFVSYYYKRASHLSKKSKKQYYGHG